MGDVFTLLRIWTNQHSICDENAKFGFKIDVAEDDEAEARKGFLFGARVPVTQLDHRGGPCSCLIALSVSIHDVPYFAIIHGSFSNSIEQNGPVTQNNSG